MWISEYHYVFCINSLSSIESLELSIWAGHPHVSPPHWRTHCEEHLSGLHNFQKPKVNQIFMLYLQTQNSWQYHLSQFPCDDELTFDTASSAVIGWVTSKSLFSFSNGFKLDPSTIRICVFAEIPPRLPTLVWYQKRMQDLLCRYTYNKCPRPFFKTQFRAAADEMNLECSASIAWNIACVARTWNADLKTRCRNFRFTQFV